MNIFLDYNYWKTATLESVKRYIEQGTDVNEKDKRGTTPLMYASMHNDNTDIINTLIANGADVNAIHKDGRTTLMFACNWNENPEIITTLINEGVDVDARDIGRWNAWDFLKQNKKLKRNKKLAALLDPWRRDS